MNNPLTIAIAIVASLIVGLGAGKSKTWASKLRFTLILTAIATSTAFIFYIIGCWKFLALGKTPTSIYQLQIISLFVVAYCLISLTFVCAIAWKKDGFKKLKNPKTKNGLIFELIGGLIFGLIVGLIFGLIVGLTDGLTFRLIGGLIAGLAGGLTLGLIFGLIFGLIAGLTEEFEKDKRINDIDKAYEEAYKEAARRKKSR